MCCCRDGVPLYGYCNDASGDQFSSCYSVVSGSSETEMDISAGTFMSAAMDTDYEYTASDDCNLDEANGNVITL